MAQEILNNLLSSKVPAKEILDWLTTDNLNKTEWFDFNKTCPREEFITFFLNYLRDQFQSVLQTSTTFKETPAKKISQHQRIKTYSTVKNKIGSQNNADNSSAAYHKETECIAKGLDPNNVNNTKVTPARCNVTDIGKLSINPQSSTPLMKTKNSPNKKRVELISCNSSQSRNINPAFKESLEYGRGGNLTDDKSFNNSSFPSLGGNRSVNLNSPNLSTNANKSECSEFHSNLSQRSNFSISNKVFQSPVSPLYSNSVHMLSPINAKTPQSRYNDNQSNSYFQLNSTSTPERIPNNDSKSSSRTPRQNFDLSEFIVTDTRSKKRSGKKNSKISQIDAEQQTLLSDTSTHSEQNTRRRKVNPTRLNTTDEKGNKENTVFGVVSRPFMQNPQFVNVSPIDKSVDNESFQVERGLVKMERQKKPENTTNENTMSNTNTYTSAVNEPPKYKILPRTPRKVVQSGSIIIPNKESVDNENVLVILAEMYSGFLDHNLIVNPMRELYYIIQLITVQYTNNTQQILSTKQKVREPINTKTNNESTDEKKHLSALRKSLNFDDFGEVEDKEKKNDKENNSEHDKSYNELGCLNLVDDAKENLNKVNTKLQEFSVTKSSDEITNNVTKKINFEEIDIAKNCVKLYLDTPHNCVYFSTLVLDYQKAFLKCLDRVTLKLLCENNQIATFQPELCKYLNTIYSVKVAESNKIKSLLNIGTLELNVCFQIDTDNREKFPSLHSFQCFRKQRDMFYDILKIWEDNHLVPGWTFQIALSGKIKSMLTMHTDITNFTHFSRLFKSQMLISCIQSGNQEDILDDETASFLKDLKDINPEKLTQLQRKLVTPVSQKGPVPLPSFPGIQEFYKDFILYASNAMFYTYLENTFISEIMDLNNSQFAGSDIEETETKVDEHTKQNFVVCLTSLRLLSKFLGFITSLPYQSETSMLEDVIISQVTLRSKVLPHIDLQYCLQTAVLQGKLSLTVPWVVEYLSMMDHASLRLPYYKKILEMLYCIYRASNYHAITNSEEFMSQKAGVMIRLSIGWLFELPIFPSELYYSWQSKYNDKALKMICEEEIINNIENNLNDAETSVLSVKHSLFLDKLEMVDDRILYSCCPFLRELNILLTPGNSNVSNSASYRHVTPVTSQLQKPTKKTNTKHLEIQLEEAFFHGQPMSTRKTVEYVSERIASSSVKYICNNLLPIERQVIFQELRNIIKEKYNDELEKNPESLKNILLKDISLLAIRASNNIKAKSEQALPKLCEARITQSIESLLAEDCLKSVKDMCVKIALRMTIERVDQWIHSHIVGGSSFIKDMNFELTKICKMDFEIDTNMDIKRHNPNAPSPTDILDESRNLIWELLETQGKTQTEKSIANFWDRLYLSLTERSDLQSPSEKIISSLSLDLCLFLITYRQDLFTDKIQEKVLRAWKIDHMQFSESDSPLSKIISPKNVVLLSQLSNNKIWITLGRFLKKLLKENILSIDLLNEQAVALFKDEWPIQVSKNLSTCLKEAIDGYRSSDEETERIRCLLEWVAGAHSDMDRDSFGFD
ncbi:codanin-1 [Nasonia vitripennis]|uniref:Codanin-1 C-terminal domain-containing protein n=1 Tax=Nasonia vitripennis TaxID=7425 RepID=A0A7M7LJ21_NASVI|nr:codanin-1 [Nasonia vitripennis]XP_032455822.1 codanin-1 [Nasonia vitripennis]